MGDCVDERVGEGVGKVGRYGMERGTAPSVLLIQKQVNRGL